MSAMKLDKWDVIIGIILGSWVILQISALTLLDTLRFDDWSEDWTVAFVLIYLFSGFYIGAFFLLGSAIVLLVRAFQASLSWGLAVLFIPFAALVFLSKHWKQSWRIFLTSLLGVALIVIGFVQAAWGY